MRVKGPVETIHNHANDEWNIHKYAPVVGNASIGNLKRMIDGLRVERITRSEEYNLLLGIEDRTETFMIATAEVEGLFK